MNTDPGPDRSPGESPAAAAPSRPHPSIVYVVRAGHLAIGAVMTAATCLLWYSAIFGVVTAWLWLAVAILAVQWTVIGLNHGHCPLGSVHARLGDSKTMFELVAGKRYAVHGFRNWGIACVTGAVLLAIRLVLRL